MQDNSRKKGSCLAICKGSIHHSLKVWKMGKIILPISCGERAKNMYMLKIGMGSACVFLSLALCFLAYVPVLLNKNFSKCPGIFSTSRDLGSMLFL